MNVFKRIVSIFSLAVLIIAVAYGLFWLRSRSLLKKNPETAIPPDFAICIKIGNVQDFEPVFRNATAAWSEVIESGIFKRTSEYYRLLDDLDSIRNNNVSVSEIFSGEVYLSLHFSDQKPEMLIIKTADEQNVTDEWLKSLGSESNIEKKKYENVTYYQMEFSNNGLFKDLLFFESSGLFVISTSEDLLQRSVRNLHGEGNVFNSEKFARISGTAGADAQANVFVNYTELDRLLKIFFRDEAIPDLSTWFSASVLDLEISPESILLNGFTGFSGIENPVYLEYSDAGKGFDLLKYIPFNPVLFDLKKGMNPLLLNDAGLNEEQAGLLNELDQLVLDESGWILNRQGKKYESIIILDLESGANTEELLKNRLGIFTSDSTEIRSEIIHIDDFSAIIYNISGNPFTRFLTVNPDPGKKYTYFVVFQNLLVIAESISSLREFMYSNLLGTTINNSNEFKELSPNFSSSSNRFVYLNTGTFLDRLGVLIKPEIAGRMKTSAGELSKFDVISFQSTRSGNLNYFRLFANYSGKLKETYNTVWERKLDTISYFKPCIVKNHRSGEKEILIQDLNHTLYLISNNGNIIWKQKLDGTVMGEIFQVDYYRNGKLQYLFNTPFKLYLIDRNGNPVERFPVSFRAEASAGISLFDYDQNGEWRIPVPSKDKKIYMYDRDGKVVSGWNYRAGDHVVDQPLLHVRVQNRDYLAAKEEFQLNLLDRQGRKRTKPDEQIHFSGNPVYLETAGNKPCLLASDRNGSVYRFYFDEKVELLFENNLSDSHYFLAEDIAGNTKKEYIFIDNQTIIVYDEKKEILFREELPEKIVFPPVVYQFSAIDKKIGVVATKTGKIYLFNNDGKQYKGFPLPGSSMFSISGFPGLKDRFNLIVSNNDNFLYNFSVQ